MIDKVGEELNGSAGCRESLSPMALCMESTIDGFFQTRRLAAPALRGWLARPFVVNPSVLAPIY